MVKKTFRIPLYQGRLVVMFTDSIDDAITKFQLDVDYGSACALTFRMGSNVYVIFENGITNPGILAHEAFHAMNRISSAIGYSTYPDNDESSAYLLTWIVNRIFEVGGLTVEKR